MPPTQPARTRPIEKLAKAVGKCSPEAAEYGKCIIADYNNVYQGKCAQSFEKLMMCVKENSARK